MKKLIPLLLIALLLTACTAAPQGNPDQQITRGTTPNEDVVTTTEATQAEQTDAFAFQVGETLVVPGTLFDATKVSYDDVYEVPSCAGEGTDKVYITADYEITAYHDGKSEITYSVIFVSPAVQTNEGLALGDDIAKAACIN